MFENYPQYRKYFKGKEEYKADDVQKDDFFKKQGQRILVAVHILGSTYDVEPAFRAYIREVLNQHKRDNIMLEFKAWEDFWVMWENFLGTKMTLDEQTKHAWKEVAKKFEAEARTHAAHIGLPH
ncbi:unnamed protein product [Gongylonema pulchrum]|uniref:GLOBIN domain-containing protein n=1 Tax=Gongylonema pulchrum TaxID=637853 RepID=A0A183DZL8_9BILA|nr:unnamed protein product [Gongylonema pulchrum]